METQKEYTQPHDHEERAHALLSPSSAHRWLICSPSARMEDVYPDESSTAALEGTIAHEMAERYADAIIVGDIDTEAPDFLKESVAQITAFLTENDLHDIDPLDIIEDAKGYATYARSLRDKMSRETGGDFVFHLTEMTIDVSEYVPEGFGSVDLMLMSDTVLHVVDYKYGRGVKVAATLNPQMMIYALGALKYYRSLMQGDPEEVRMTIYQPRISNYDTWSIPTVDLLTWAEEELEPLAKKAFDGKGEQVTGKHCRFCRAKADCKAKQQELYDLSDFALEHPEPETLTDEELGKVLALAESVRDYLKSCEEEAMSRIARGDTVTGWKVVPGRSVRKVKDEEALAERLTENGYSEEDFYERKLLGITKLEKLVGKKVFNADYSDLIEKPEGKPTLVPDDDPRAEKSAYDKEDFKL